MSPNSSRQHRENVFWDSVSELMATLDLDLRIQWANRAAGDSVNAAPETLVGHYCYQVWHGRQSPCEDCPVQRTIQTGEAHKNEVESPDGRHWLIRSYPLFSPQGKLEGVAELTLEITQSKQSEEKLRKSSDLLSKTQEIAQVGSWELDLVGNSLTWSQEVYRIFGLKPQEFTLTYEDFLERIHPEDRAMVDAAYSSSLQQGKDSYEVDHRIIRADTGEVRYVQEKCYHERDSAGNVTRSVGMVQDITPRKTAEEDLRLSEKNLSQTLHSIGDAVITTDRRGRIVRMNPVAEELTAWGLQEAQGKALADVFRIVEAESRHRCEDPVQKVFISGETRGLANHTVLIAKDGREYQIADSAAPIRDDNEEITGVVLVFRNVTEEYTTRRLTEKRLELVEYAASHTLDEFLTKMLDEVGSFVNSPIGFYHFVHPDQKTLTLQQWSTKTLQDFCSIEAKGRHYPLEQAGVWVDCVRTKKPTIHNDYASLPHKQGLPQGHPQVVRELVVPVQREGKIMAILGVGNKSSDYTEKDQEIVSFFADVTWEIVQQKQTEARVRDLNLFLRSTLDSLYYHIAVLDEQGEIVLANLAWRDFAEENGSPAEDVSEGSNYLAVCANATGENSEGAQSFAEGIRMVISGDRDSYSMEYPCHSPDKQQWFIGRVTPFSDTPPRRVVVGHEEITERKQIENALRQSESYYRTIFETSGSAMLIVEEDTTISLVNSNFEELSGYSREELEGKKSWNDFVHSVDVARRRQNQPSRHHSATEAPLQYEIRLLTRNSEARDVFLTLDMIPGSKQSIVSCLDITQRKQMEEKLKEISFHDSLTGLYNRNFFEEEMTRLEDGRYSPVGIVVCDLDGLKFINDTLGHQSGDQMLVHVADILRHNFRFSDIIARIGGDEFAVLLTEIDSGIMEQMLQRLRQAVQEYNNTEPEIPLSLSMGHALGEGAKVDMQALFRQADNRMYREKIQREGSARSAILQALTGSMQARDFNTQGHCDRLQGLAASLGSSLELSQDIMNDLHLLARFHDLGKVGISDHILFKPGPLTEEEWGQMRQHCEIGHRIASSVPDLETIADLILKHHERWDGQGYPLGLSGEDIPLACRILAIADAYDAMTRDRPYRRAMSREKAISELRRFAGTQFDPELVEQFIPIIGQRGF